MKAEEARQLTNKANQIKMIGYDQIIEVIRKQASRGSSNCILLTKSIHEVTLIQLKQDGYKINYFLCFTIISW